MNCSDFTLRDFYIEAVKVEPFFSSHLVHKLSRQGRKRLWFPTHRLVEAIPISSGEKEFG